MKYQHIVKDEQHGFDRHILEIGRLRLMITFQSPIGIGIRKGAFGWNAGTLAARFFLFTWLLRNRH